MSEGDIILVDVILLYHGPKAELFTMGGDHAIEVLKTDLQRLKIPHPKRDNIHFTTQAGYSGCQFFWPEAARGGVLHRAVEGHIQASRLPGNEILKDLSIAVLDFNEELVKHGERATRKRKLHEKRYGNLTWFSDKALQDQNTMSLSKIDEAQELLNDMAASLRPNIVPKTEPIDHPLLFDSHPRHDSIASSRPSSPPTIQMPSQKAMQNSSPMSISPSTRSFPPPFISSTSQTMVSSSQIETQPPSPSIPRKRPLSPDPSDDTRPGTRPPPDPSDLSAIRELTRELWNLRRQITAGVAREAAIIKELKNLNSAFVPEIATLNRPTEDPEFTLRILERELLQEKKRREEVEAVLQDIERECREPFIVPALFDAFITISKITTQAIDTAL